MSIKIFIKKRLYTILVSKQRIYGNFPKKYKKCKKKYKK